MTRGGFESWPAGDSIAGQGDTRRDRTPPSRIARSHVTCQFTVAALVILANAALLSPASAEGDTAGVFDAISDLFKSPEDSAVTVPKRRKTDASEPDESVQPLPPPVVVPKRRRNEVVQPPAAEAIPAVTPADRASGEPAPARDPIEVPERGEGVQPWHVLRRVRDLISEIDIIREELNVHDYPAEAELVQDRAPIYVYAKSLEVLAKVVETQRQLEVPAGGVGQIPFKDVDYGDVLAQIESLLDELRKIKAHMGIERRIQPAPLDSEATSSMIYKSLADASFMLDGVRGRPVTPDDVYRNTQSVLDEIVLIAERLDVPLDLVPPRVEGTKKPFDVALQIKRATYKLISLQTRLRMNASQVPIMRLLSATPSENLDATYMLLAEMARIKFHLGIDVPRTERAEQPQGKDPDDAFALATLIDQNLDKLAAAASR